MILTLLTLSCSVRPLYKLVPIDDICELIKIKWRETKIRKKNKLEINFKYVFHSFDFFVIRFNQWVIVFQLFSSGGISWNCFYHLAKPQCSKKYRRPSLSAGLLFAVLTILGLWIVNKICYPRTFPWNIRGFGPLLVAKGHKKANAVFPCYLRFWYLRNILGT